MTISLAQLQRIIPNAGPRAGVFHGPLVAAMDEFAIDREPLRIAGFLAQVAVETQSLQKLVENMNYSARGLLDTFPRYFNGAAAAEYARQPDRIGNRAYANRMGNGDEASGDGYRYRGRGLLHCTGRDIYRRCGIALGLPLEAEPELLEQVETACRSGGWIWAIEKSLNPIADRDDIVLMTKRINGGTNGLSERVAFYERAKRVLGV